MFVHAHIHYVAADFRIYQIVPQNLTVRRPPPKNGAAPASIHAAASASGVAPLSTAEITFVNSKSLVPLRCMRRLHMRRLNVLRRRRILPLALLTLLPRMIIPLRRAAIAIACDMLLMPTAIVRRTFLTRRR